MNCSRHAHAPRVMIIRDPGSAPLPDAIESCLTRQGESGEVSEAALCQAVITALLPDVVLWVPAGADLPSLASAANIAHAVAVPGRIIPLVVLLPRAGLDSIRHLLRLGVTCVVEWEEPDFDLERDLRRVGVKAAAFNDHLDDSSRLSNDFEVITRELLRERAMHRSLSRLLFRALTRLSVSRDFETSSHMCRVALYSFELVEGMNLNGTFGPTFGQDVLLLAPLHDIGKAGIPDAILLKPGPLTSEERTIMQSHTTIGRLLIEEILQSDSFFSDDDVGLLKMARDICASHHECWDGTGYPSGLRGEDIPMAARIVAVADCYDALASARPYRPDPWPHDAIISHLLAGGGSRFDPQVVRSLLNRKDRFLEIRGKVDEVGGLTPIPTRGGSGLHRSGAVRQGMA